MRVLVTGAAGFIGFHTASALLRRGDEVIGVDSINDYYDPAIKHARVAELVRISKESGRFEFLHLDLADADAVRAVFSKGSFDRVIHLAAQAGVRYSLENPLAYVQSNIVAFTHMLEACRFGGLPHLTYASTSSVYGANTRMPFSEDDTADHPLQFYAATKRANELMAHSYSHLYRLPTTGLRFFTVYGPWGRPDMALFLFTRKILAGEKIQVFNHGDHVRDFTYVTDIVEGIIRASDDTAVADVKWSSDAPNPSTSSAPYRLFNIGNSNPVKLTEYIDALEAALGRTAEREYLPMQAGDVPTTFANVERLQSQLGYRPRTSVRDGIVEFVKWYRAYFRV